MKQILLAVLAVALALPVAAQQQGTGEALQWLQRVATAAQKLSYTGVFVYQSGNRSETSRITHVVDGSGDMERIEVLDGSPREVVRQNDEVKCYLPESRLLIVERRGNRRAFPALLPASIAGLIEHYAIRKGALGRVAGLDSQLILIEPRDEFRYGHQLWIDTQSGLLLKAALTNDKGEALETFAFTDLRLGGTLGRDSVRSQFEAAGGDWQVHNVRATEAKGDEAQWLFRQPLPGFRRVSGMKRQVRPDGPEGVHFVFSDGLAAVSVFIEPLSGGTKPEGSLYSMGAITVFKRQLGNQQVVVMGDVPPVALQRFAEGIEPRKK